MPKFHSLAKMKIPTFVNGFLKLLIWLRHLKRRSIPWWYTRIPWSLANASMNVRTAFRGYSRIFIKNPNIRKKWKRKFSCYASTRFEKSKHHKWSLGVALCPWWIFCKQFDPSKENDFLNISVSAYFAGVRIFKMFKMFKQSGTS